MRPALAAVVVLATTGCAAQTAPPQPSRELLDVAAAYAAKVAAAAVFVAGRPLESVLEQELAPTHPIEALVRPLLRFEVDRDRRRVQCRIGAASATAVLTDGLGTTLVLGDADVHSITRRRAPSPAAHAPEELQWPDRDVTPGADDAFDAPALTKAIDDAFADPADGRRVFTRAVVVVHEGRLVAERYAPGFHRDMALPGWSVTKTLTHALLGVAIQDGLLDPQRPPAVEAWAAEGDPRAAIRLDDLLTMRSGLAWNESYDDPASDVLRMLFRSPDHAAVYAARPSESPPGAAFVYSSGATNLACAMLRRAFAADAAYHAFPRTRLFDRLGMRTAVLETDASGTFVGSSYGHASARDWARLGWLYASDGVVAGGRVLPAGFVRTAATPVTGTRGRYGRHLWLNADGEDGSPRRWPDLPADVLLMDGHEGQHVVVVPSRRIVIVRLGCTKNGGFDLRALVRATLTAQR
jgi:CubicO group peptidase (beta-lactamase class C family)